MHQKPQLSTRADHVARWFGLHPRAARRAGIRLAKPPAIDPGPARLILITGPSGAGKSSLLRALRRRSPGRWIDLRRIPLPRALVIDLMTDALGGGDSEQAIVAALRALSRVGLGEVWTYLRTPAQLSVGQRWRLRLAMALAAADRAARAEDEPPPRIEPIRPPPLITLSADEFAASLDRITALIVARALRKAVAARPFLRAVVATPRDDFLAALEPDLLVHCDFGTCDIHPKGDRS